MRIDLRKLYGSFNEEEKVRLCFGLFPVRTMELNLDNHEAAELIRMAQKAHNVRL